MDKIFDLLSKVIYEQLTPSRVMSRILATKLEQVGVNLDDAQEDQLTSIISSQLEPNSFKPLGDTITVEFADLGLQEDELSRADSIDGEITDKDFEEFQLAFDGKAKTATKEAIELFANAVQDHVRNNATQILETLHAATEGFYLRFNQLWGPALQLLELFIGICLEAGTEFNERYRPGAVEKNDMTFEVLTRLHARGCQIALEILVLLKSGLADGANARWRTLHELLVIASFIRNHGNEVAERYIAHQVIDEWKSLKEYYAREKALGREADVDEVDEGILRDVERLRSKYGKAFITDYGWAANALGMGRPRFTDIERSVNLSLWRPEVQVAHSNVHATARGAYYGLGLGDITNVMLAGPSNYGLTIPGKNATYALGLMTVVVIGWLPSMDFTVYMKAIQQLTDDVYKAFNEAEERYAAEVAKRSGRDERTTI